MTTVWILLEVKRGRAIEDEEAKELVSQKKSSNGRGTVPSRKNPTNCTCQKEEARPSLFHLESAPLSKKKWKERMDKEKEKGKEGTPKKKKKTPTYKLLLIIKSSIDLKGILKERILDAKIEFTMR